MTDCNKCNNKNMAICKRSKDIFNCEYFTYDKFNIKEAKQRLINDNTKDDLYEMFFYTIRMYLDGNSPYNQYDDIVLYFSLDQNKFLKRHARNDKPTGNWIEIPYNKDAFFWLKDQLQFTNPKKTISFYGRKLPNTYSHVKDDIWRRLIGFIKVTFQKFYNSNRVILERPQKNTNATTKPLF